MSTEPRTTTSLEEAARDFLAQERIAVVGVSRSGGEAANLIYRKLRETGHRVFPVNPSAERVEDDRCYADLAALANDAGPVDAVLIATHPEVTAGIVRQCVEQGVDRVWIHRSFGQGSLSQEAIDLCSENGIRLIPGGCPMMFEPPVDIGHRCMRWLLRVTGGLPKAA